MTTLRRLRLVNWHFFTDETIEIGPATLLAGDNGTGKSTIIDAIQYALVARIGKIRFNAAASDRRASRTLESYCLCKIGADSLGTVRESCITHVILEFEDKTACFVAGIMVEAFADGCREHPWILPDGRIRDVPVFEGEHFITPSAFREAIRQNGGRPCSTKGEYNSRLTHLLRVHRSNAEFNPYLEAVVRSVTFTPFTSVHDFVLNYILEERNVDISAMKENLENYRLAEREAIAMEEKIGRLRSIREKGEEVEKLARQIIMQEYFRRRIEAERFAERTEQAEQEAEETVREIGNLEDSIRAGRERRERIDTMRQEAMFALAQNDAHRLYESLIRGREEVRNKAAGERERVDRAHTLRKQCEAMLGRNLEDSIEREIETVDEERHGYAGRRVQLEATLAEAKGLLSELHAEQRELERGILRYPEASMALKRAIEEAGIDAWIFADLLEVTDPAWQNAVEGWLNTQRFNVLVPEREFQRALEIYHRLPVRTAGVGLPNLVRMHEAAAMPGSLAEVVEAASPAGRRYAVYLLGEVIRAEIGTLKQHEKAITRECMRYASHTASRIREDVYGRWFIGKEAKHRRLEEVRKLILETTRTVEETIREIRTLTEREEILKRVYTGLHDLRALSDAPQRLASLEEEFAEIEQRIAGIDTSGFESLKLQIASLARSMKEIELEIEGLVERLGRKKQARERLLSDREHYLADRDRCRAVLEGFLTEHPGRDSEFEEYYRERMRGERKPGGVDFDAILSRYNSALQGITTRRDRSRNELAELQRSYNNDFNVYYPVDGEDTSGFVDLLLSYEETEFPSYREKIENARSAADRQFREHFVSRLSEYIAEARESFREINYLLATIPFGQDLYHFTIQELPEKRGLLEVIRKAAEIREVENTLFEATVTEEERASIERMFEDILRNDLDSDTVRQICDYRRYFGYDIRIRHTETIDPKTGRPLESSLSKVLREKSGGETQTPYYVAIAASFYRFYQDEPDAVRLVLFDEAFSKMDDERIGTMIEFFRKLGMQVITAVPTEKIESIAPFMDRTALVLRRDYHACVRDYAVAPVEMEQV